MKRKILLLIIVIALMAGCSSIDVSPTAQTFPTIFVSSATPVVAPSTPVPTSSPLNATSTSISDSVATDSCLAVVEKEISLDSIASGTVLMGKGYNYGQFLLDLSTGSEYDVVTQSQCTFCVRWAMSPAKNLLAGAEELQNKSSQFEETTLWILNAKAETLEKVTLALSGLYDIRWLDEQNIIFHTEQTTKDGAVMLFNPFTQEQRNIYNELPDFYTENYFYPNLGWLIEYSPNLEWGIYFGITQDAKLGYVVRDFTNEKTILQIEDISGEYQKPLWSPNGDEVAVVTGGIPFLISRAGEVKPILDESQQSQVARLSWSPNGRYIAFWNFDTLMIYDKQGNNVSDTCFKSDNQLPLIWSPNSGQLAIPKYKGDSGTLIDIQENKIYTLTPISEIIYPMEWMNSIP